VVVEETKVDLNAQIVAEQIAHQIHQ